jgi:hypothetical protein
MDSDMIAFKDDLEAVYPVFPKAYSIRTRSNQIFWHYLVKTNILIVCFFIKKIILYQNPWIFNVF